MSEPPPRRAVALRWHLVLLVAGALLPMVVFAAVVVYRHADSERAAADRRLMRSAQQVSDALDREIQATVRALTALAESERLDAPDLQPFYVEAKRVVPTQPAWLMVILLRPDGQQVVNTNMEWGTPLPTVLDADSLRRAVETKRPVVGGIMQGKLRPGFTFSVRVPVIRGGEVRYVLTAVSTPDALAGVVGLKDPTNVEWARAIVDSRGVIATRSSEPERFVGQPARPSLLQRINESGEGLVRETTRDGTPVYVAFKRDAFSGWTATVAAPVSTLDSPTRDSTLAILALGLALLSLSTIGAFAVSRRVTRGLSAATAAAETMAQGGRPRVGSSAVREVAQLGRALAHSSALLARRERERNEHLARADAARAEAESARRAQEELFKGLRESEERFAKAFESSPLALTITSLKTGRLLEVNETFTRLSGYTRDEAVGRTTLELGLWAAPEDREAELATLAQSGQVRNVEYRFRMRDGAEMIGLLSAEQIEIGGEPCALTVIEDITEQKRAAAERERLLEREKALRAKAEEANRLKDEFLATVSHELRTPLTAIMGWSHMLEDASLDAETARHAVNVIRRNAEQQRQIVEDILDVSRIVSGKLRLESERVELALVMRAALDTITPAAEARAIRLRSALDPAALVTGDAARLQQVVWNLLSNAVKFTPPGGEVRVSAARLLTHVRIEVSDTGQGLSPEFLPYAFDRFRQADSSTTRVHGGLGLGLSVVRHLVEAHGGSVHAYSAGEGQGATFTVDLPLPLEAEPDEPPSAGESEAAHGSSAHAESDEAALPPLVGLRVLLVDDDADTLEMLKMFMRRAGAEVTGAPSASAALDALGRARPDVIVADIGMPGVDGYEFVRRLRALGADRGGQTPAVALTAYAGESDRLRALRTGFQAHLAKPIDPAALIATLVNLAARPAPRET
ncbi:MAG TPA: ATP-binding protein [Pyrinomonadaceae bacterium]